MGARVKCRVKCGGGDMQQTVREFLDFFDFDLADGDMRIRLLPGAPQDLLALVRKLKAEADPSLLVCVYEGLSGLADADSPFSCEIDAKVCPPEVFHPMLGELMRLVSEGRGVHGNIADGA